MADDIGADVLNSLKHVPDGDRSFRIFWVRTLDEMSRLNPNWKGFGSLMKSQLGAKGTQLYNHLYYRWC